MATLRPIAIRNNARFKLELYLPHFHASADRTDRLATISAMFLYLLILLALLSAVSSADLPKPASVRTDPNAGLHHVKIDGKTIPEILGPVLNYSFSLPQSALRKGTGYLGANFRLRRVVRDMLSGKRPVKIGIVGELTDMHGDIGMA